MLPYLKQEEPGGVSTSQPPLPAFQYVLCAPTSPAVRHHEETLTYLNQGESGGAGRRGHPPKMRAQLPLPSPPGQSYEIRMMGTPRGDPAEGRRMMKVSGVGGKDGGRARGKALGWNRGSAPVRTHPNPSPDPVQTHANPGPDPVRTHPKPESRIHTQFCPSPIFI